MLQARISVLKQLQVTDASESDKCRLNKKQLSVIRVTFSESPSVSSATLHVIKAKLKKHCSSSTRKLNRHKEPVSPYFRFSSSRERSERLDIALSRSMVLGERVMILNVNGKPCFKAFSGSQGEIRAGAHGIDLKRRSAGHSKG